MYHKGHRESMDCLDDIVLIQASGLENDSAIQDLKITCKIKRLIVYRYDESKSTFYDVSQSTSPVHSLKTNLKGYLKRAADHIQYDKMNFHRVDVIVSFCFFRKGLADRYISRMNTRKKELPDNNAYRDVRQ